jgi:hypothetical protein
LRELSRLGVESQKTRATQGSGRGDVHDVVRAKAVTSRVTGHQRFDIAFQFAERQRRMSQKYGLFQMRGERTLSFFPRENAVDAFILGRRGWNQPESPKPLPVGLEIRQPVTAVRRRLLGFERHREHLAAASADLGTAKLAHLRKDMSWPAVQIAEREDGCGAGLVHV